MQIPDPRPNHLDPPAHSEKDVKLLRAERDLVIKEAHRLEEGNGVQLYFCLIIQNVSNKIITSNKRSFLNVLTDHGCNLISITLVLR